MQLVSTSDFKDRLNNLPYFFFPSFEGFINKSSTNSYLLFYSKEHEAFMPVNRITIKMFRLLQIIYPPVSLSGQRLSPENEKGFLNDFVHLVKKKFWAYALSSLAAIVCLMHFRTNKHTP